MDILSYLTDVYGARLTGSPQIRAAGEWAKKKLMEWELVNVNLEPWGPFGRGWSNENFSARVNSTSSFQVIAYPKAWTPGTSGPITADVVAAVINNDQDLDKFRGQLRGKFVMITPLRDVPALFEAPGHRFTDEELLAMSNQPVQPPRGGGPGPWCRRRTGRSVPAAGPGRTRGGPRFPG